jgi:glutamate dehydrogenase
MNAVVSVRHAYDREAFLKAARSRFKAAFGENGPDSESFLDQLWGDALADDLASVSDQDAISLAEEFWRYGEERAADKILIRVRTAHGATDAAWVAIFLK